MTAQLGVWLSFGLIGVGLILVVEGLVYAIFPEGMRKLLVRMVDVPVSSLRSGGLVAAIAGLGILWVMKIV